MSVAANAAATKTDFDRLWDYAKPAESEARFRELLPAAREGGDTGYLGQLLTQIARAEGLQRKFAEAHRTLDEVSRLAAEQSVPPVVRVRLALERGRVFRSSREVAKSRPLFIEAWELATREKLEFHAVDAAHMLGIIEPGEEAVAWNLKAIAAAEAATDERARGWLGALANNLGWTYFERKEYPRALEMLRKSLESYRERKRDREVRVARWSIAKVQRVMGEVEPALAEQQSLEKEWAAAGEPDGYVYEELGECLLALQRDAEARPWFRKAHELLSRDTWLVENEPARLKRLKELGEGA